MLKATLKYNVGSKPIMSSITARCTATARDMRLIEKRAEKLSGQSQSRRQVSGQN